MADTGRGNDFVGVATVLEASMGCGEFMTAGYRATAGEPEGEEAGSAMSEPSRAGVA